MDVLILVAVLLAGAAYVAQPLYAPVGPARRTPPAHLEARRDALVQMLRDLDQDRRSGLIEEAEYERQRDAAEGEAASVLRSLDELRRPIPGPQND